MKGRRRVNLTPYLSEQDLRRRLEVLAQELARDYHGHELVIVGLLKGSFIFMADLVRLLSQHDQHVVIDFMIVASYGSGTESSGQVELVRDITADIAGRPVLLVDDILDSGRTMTFAVAHLQGKHPESLRTCVFLDKPERRVVPFRADYTGFTVPDRFLVGYGLDYDSRYRELPHLSIVSFADQPAG